MNQLRLIDGPQHAAGRSRLHLESRIVVNEPAVHQAKLVEEVEGAEMSRT